MEIDIESNIMKVCTHTWSMGKFLSTDIMRMRGKEGEREREGRNWEEQEKREDLWARVGEIIRRI